MINKELLVLGVVFLGMFTMFKIENEKIISKCRHDVVIQSSERPSLYEIYD